jgi:hypothetical protein
VPAQRVLVQPTGTRGGDRATSADDAVELRESVLQLLDPTRGRLFGGEDLCALVGPGFVGTASPHGFGLKLLDRAALGQVGGNVVGRRGLRLVVEILVSLGEALRCVDQLLLQCLLLLERSLEVCLSHEADTLDLSHDMAVDATQVRGQAGVAGLAQRPTPLTSQHSREQVRSAVPRAVAAVEEARPREVGHGALRAVGQVRAAVLLHVIPPAAQTSWLASYT